MSLIQSQALTTKLSAVNMMLREIGESPVATLQVPSNQDAANALDILDHWNVSVQEEGWRFNTRLNVTLARNISGEILLPLNTLRVDTTGTDISLRTSFIDGKLFNVDKDSFVFDADVTVDLILLYEYESTPQALRTYVLELAGLDFLSKEKSASSRFSELRVARAKSSLRRSESIVRDANMLDDSWHAAKFSIGRQPNRLVKR